MLLAGSDIQASPDRIVAAAQGSGFVELPVRSAAALKVRALLITIRAIGSGWRLRTT
jgi:hypothetical protein